MLLVFFFQSFREKAERVEEPDVESVLQRRLEERRRELDQQWEQERVTLHLTNFFVRSK